MNKRRVANLLLSSVNAFSLLSGQAFAGTGTITTKDAGGVTRTFDVITNSGAATEFGAVSVICDGSGLVNCAAVKPASTSAAATDPAFVTVDYNVGYRGDSHGCSAANSLIGCLGQVDDDAKGAIPAGTNAIGTTTIAVNQGNAFTPLHVCGSYTSLSMSAVTSQLMILGSSGKTIYICDFDISNSSTSTTTLNFAIGTGTNCANGSSALGQNWYLSASWGKAASNSYYRGLSSAALASASLCAKSSNTTTVDLGVYYDQY